MAANEIEWNIAICASTYAELGEAWSGLHAISTKLGNPDGGSVLSEAEASQDFDHAVASVTKALQGLDSFLNIQGAYLERIRAEYLPVDLPAQLFAPSIAIPEAENANQAAILEEEEATGFQTEDETVMPDEQAETLLVPGFAQNQAVATTPIAPANPSLQNSGPTVSATRLAEPLVMPLYQPQPGWMADWNRRVNYGAGTELNSVMPDPTPWTLAVRYQPS